MRVPSCIRCKHLDQDPERWVCAAYPRGIPDEILSGEVDHTKPNPGDQGIRFEPAGKDDGPTDGPYTTP